MVYDQFKTEVPMPTQEDIDRTCNDLAEKLSLNETSKNEVKIALVDVLEEALQGNVYGKIATNHDKTIDNH